MSCYLPSHETEIQMVDKSNVDKHRSKYSSGVKAVEEQKWGRQTARERYGSLKYENGAPRPADKRYPQFKQDQPGPNYANQTSGWVHGENEDATKKPNFDRGGKRR
jgi:hypothetical protein